jgi:hypothetical protein
MDAPHYLRFARTLALATTIALPACSGADASTEEETPGAPTSKAPSSAAVVPATEAPTAAAPPAPAGPIGPVSPTAAEFVETEASAATDPQPDAGSYQGHSSGPLPPPEMPACFA